MGSRESMNIISTNIGQPVEIDWRGKKVKTGIYKYASADPIFLDHEDVLNDYVMDRKHHGGVDKACYIYGSNRYPYWQEKYPGLDWRWGMFGENLTIENIDESKICIGDIFRLGTALVQVTQPRQPCFKLGVRFGSQKMVGEFLKSPYPGVYVRVLAKGYVGVGDEMILQEQAEDSMSLSEVFALFTTGTEQVEQLEKAIAIPSLAEACRKDLRKLMNFANGQT